MRIIEVTVDEIFGGPRVHNPNEINPYVGCMFHCTYCYVEGNERPQSDLYVKMNAAELVERDIETRDPGVAIFLSSQTDPYLYAEKKYRITRACIERVAQHPQYRLSILTKSDMIVRDIDLLRNVPCTIQFSITVDNPELQRLIEPSAPSVARRLEAIRRLESEGIRTSVRMKPFLPFGFTDARKVIEMVADVTTGPIVVQGIDIGSAYMKRMAELALKHAPRELTRWLEQPEDVRTEREDIVQYLKRHPRVKYEDIRAVYQDVQTRFG
ncbi:radical SAM protein, partial [Pyxidicoccus fallax]